MRRYSDDMRQRIQRTLDARDGVHRDLLQRFYDAWMAGDYAQAEHYAMQAREEALRVRALLDLYPGFEPTSAARIRAEIAAERGARLH